MTDVPEQHLEAAIRGAWALDTCDPVDADDWCAANPSRGQCGSTALTIHDLLGGDLLIAEVRSPLVGAVAGLPRAQRYLASAPPLCEGVVSHCQARAVRERRGMMGDVRSGEKTSG